VGVIERDPDETARQLARWLAGVAGVDDVHVDEVSIPGSTGWSNETVFFDARWSRDGEVEHHRLVARIAPSGYTVFPDDTFDMQYEIMRALAERTTVPMASVHWFEQATEWFGQPFWVMSRIDGDIAADAPPYASAGFLYDASLADRERAWWAGVEAMASIHDVPLDKLGTTALTALTALTGAPDPLAAHLDHLERFLAWAEDGTPHAPSHRALDILRRTAPPFPAQGPALCWGDARLSNLIFRDFSVVAVLDWEMASIGDPMLDVGWWIFADDALTTGSGCERLPGFPSRVETAERWSRLTGRSADTLDYFELAGALRFTIIMLRMGKLLAEMGFVPDGFAYDNLISQALEKRLG
jgi:aminoglycoside phosphotransferase (APT) family kinase protein